jgi:hypothetical protein
MAAAILSANRMQLARKRVRAARRGSLHASWLNGAGVCWSQKSLIEAFAIPLDSAYLE